RQIARNECAERDYGGIEIATGPINSSRGPYRAITRLCKDDCERLCWNLAGPLLGEALGSFTEPCTQWLHKADYKPQRIPEGTGQPRSYSDRERQAGRPHKKQSVPQSSQGFSGKRTP
uniref:Uncharacterized protein n=1 Tax=Sinocyclocheilus rhinocerous TaxID=307959 RepID=A0A673I694_9TELE